MKLIIAIFIALFPLVTFANSSLPPNRHIAVQGKGEVLAKPDLAKISFEVVSMKKESLDAKRDVDARVNLFLNGLDKYGVAESAVSASNLLTTADMQYLESGEEKRVGYIASRSLKVTIDDINKMNEIVDFALSVKINEVTNIELLSSKAKELEAQATQNAVENAKVKGKVLASSFGASLGNIYSINSNNNRSNYGYHSMYVERIDVTGSKMSESPFAAGRYLEISITFESSINVVFDLEIK
ncbi:SIMPL domain-containing protein [Pseudoalteromonas sp. 13-15]|jgi:uncharacterized protein YggE|uniref:SIMPL domain-containing protein n=1 Tax=Pseudoalteromonas TaxID=53246 RepID=UPI0007308957|nr:MULTISPECIES: SIMPL domain-containing protein [Pseudoalteromonas]AUL74763.1 SIMPL domain-containing protein [Pseudoalteromonas sp. 13-15]MDP2484183.1 SIMPL domain-containing protein [Pseudoalteromonas marina]WFO19633.1 SIMPL domain-containing protein [Pseudoalteromonas sp. H100]SIO08798.1 hypothetical protein SAMN05878071_2959 [Pseudoalteromonas marina]|tara:strand:- start:620 stop:1345 length:726 start_codon:yes stop_codon:yes gene_type:complete